MNFGGYSNNEKSKEALILIGSGLLLCFFRFSVENEVLNIVGNIVLFLIAMFLVVSGVLTFKESQEEE